MGVRAALVLTVHTIVVFLGDDSLYYGDQKKNKFAEAFQRNFPSRQIAQELEIGQADAVSRWFDEFNRWGSPEHERFQDYSRTVRRGFSCRFVYYVQTAGRWLFWTSAIWLGAEFALTYLNDASVLNPEAKLACTATFLAVWVLFRTENRIAKDAPTGVWRRFNEINERNSEWVAGHLDVFKSQVEQ